VRILNQSIMNNFVTLEKKISKNVQFFVKTCIFFARLHKKVCVVAKIQKYKNILLGNKMVAMATSVYFDFIEG